MFGFMIHLKNTGIFHTHSRARLSTNLVQRCILKNGFVTDHVFISRHLRPYVAELKIMQMKASNKFVVCYDLYI